MNPQKNANATPKELLLDRLYAELKANPTGTDEFEAAFKYIQKLEPEEKDPELLELEKAGQAMVFFPDGFTTSNGEKNIARLARAFADGQAQVARELPAWQEWLGQPK